MGSPCDVRYYYPATSGLFKLRAADGDLVWECRPNDYGGSEIGSYRNLGVSILSDGRIIFGGAYEHPSYGYICKARVITETDGQISLIEETEDVDAEVASFTTGAFNFQLMHNEDYIYLSGQLTNASDIATGERVITKFDISDLSFIEQRTFSISGGPMAIPVSGPEIDLFVRSAVPTDQKLRKYDTLNGTEQAATPYVANFTFAKDIGIPRDDDYYYLSDVNSPGLMTSINKFLRSDLSLVAQSADTGARLQATCDVRDGYIAGPVTGGFKCWDTATLTLQCFSTSSDGITASGAVCSAYGASIRVGSSSEHPGTVTTWKVKRIDISDGSADWDITLQASDARALEWERWPKIYISQDQERIYVVGPLSHDGVGSGALKMVLYCLDADDGSVLWSFSGGFNDGVFPNGGSGMSLIESGEYVYVTSLRTQSTGQR